MVKKNMTQPDYNSFEGFDTGFELSSESGPFESDEDFATVDRDSANLFEGDNDESDDGTEE